MVNIRLSSYYYTTFYFRPNKKPQATACGLVHYIFDSFCFILFCSDEPIRLHCKCSLVSQSAIRKKKIVSAIVRHKCVRFHITIDFIQVIPFFVVFNPTCLHSAVTIEVVP
nr:MAG TPA: hypothetical protein [Caudoviricetes sp.]